MISGLRTTVTAAEGKTKWVSIAITTDEEWQAFCKAVGKPEWTKDERFSDTYSRWQNQEELDKLITEWTINHTHYEVMDILQKAGVASGAVLDHKELLEDPHLNERGFYEVVDREVVGTHPYPGSPIRLSRTPARIRMPAPCLGEHNEYILGNIAGLSKDEIQELVDEQIIGTRPFGM